VLPNAVAATAAGLLATANGTVASGGVAEVIGTRAALVVGIKAAAPARACVAASAESPAAGPKPSPRPPATAGGSAPGVALAWRASTAGLVAHQVGLSGAGLSGAGEFPAEALCLFTAATGAPTEAGGMLRVALNAADLRALAIRRSPESGSATKLGRRFFAEGMPNGEPVADALGLIPASGLRPSRATPLARPTPPGDAGLAGRAWARPPDEESPVASRSSSEDAVRLMLLLASGVGIEESAGKLRKACAILGWPRFPTSRRSTVASGTAPDALVLITIRATGGGSLGSISSVMGGGSAAGAVAAKASAAAASASASAVVRVMRSGIGIFTPTGQPLVHWRQMYGAPSYGLNSTQTWWSRRRHTAQLTSCNRTFHCQCSARFEEKDTEPNRHSHQHAIRSAPVPSLTAAARRASRAGRGLWSRPARHRFRCHNGSV
jgi:hypothetical protein